MKERKRNERWVLGIGRERREWNEGGMGRRALDELSIAIS